MKDKTILLLLLCVSILDCFSAKLIAKTTQEESRYTPYCGISCVYAFLQINDIPCDFQDFVSPDYITSRKGSRMSDLKQAIADHGLFSECIANLTITAQRITGLS